MANNKAPEIKGTIGMEYDSTGAREAKEDIKETAKATEEAAASTEQAAQESSAASDKEAERQKQLAEMMRLTMMTRKELRAEILRLIDAQKSAAAQNNSKAYEELTTSINRAKEALEKLNTAQQVGMIAMQQQAQTGMQFAQGLGSMKTAAGQGAAGLATMATQAIALGMAIKAGLGPIGWVMAALQGLGMIVTYFSDKSKKEEEAIKATTAALREKKKALDDLAAAEDKNSAAMALADADDQAAAIRKAGDKEMDELRDKNEKARAEREKALLDLRKDNEEKRKADAEAVRTGQLSPEEAAAREQERNAKIQAAEKDAEAVAAAEEKTLLEKEKALAPKLLEARRQALRDLAGSMNEQELAVVSVEDKALQQLVQRADEAKARDEQWKQKADEAKAAWEDDATEENFKKWESALKVQTEAHFQRQQLEEELLNRTKEQVDVLQENGQLQAKTKVGRAKEAVQIITGINAAKKGVEEQEEANKALDEKLAQLEQQLEVLEQEKTELKTAVDEAGKEAKAAAEGARLREEWKEEQKKAAPQRIAFLRDALGQLEEGTALHRQYNELFSQEVAAAQATARQEEWQRVQREGSLEDQAVWLRKTAACLEAGSEEAKKWVEQLQSVNTRSIQEALGNLEKDYKVTGSYTARDRRMQGEILAADGRALAARAQRLRQLMAETNDYDLRRQLQEQLDETVKQQRGLAEATRQAAQEARKSLKNYAPPEFQSQNRMVQRNLDNTAHAYARLAKTAERQAEAGNTKGLERTKRLMQNYADRLGRLGHDQQKANDLFRRDADLLDQIAASDSKRKKHADKREKAERKSADASKKQADLKDAQSAPDKAALEQQDTKAALENARAALEQNEKALGEMQARVAEALALAARVAGAAESIAKAAGKSVAALKKRCTALEKDVENLWSEVDA